ncbi:trihelix transcription factor ASIL2 isoform X2 [Cryptomeria japonica]|uniref:trihelix transcription factor ASIL2 isoform X2 n=1 Tax=Cryptomeria japonica TaxID=3369 RepID=UPI0025AC3BEB|nr:trihelix transcription factor ASIL2 isoform X2 [Cryptomeria japonica]
MGKLDSMESKPPQRAAVVGGGGGGGSNVVVVVNGNNNNNNGSGELTTPLSKTAPERIKRDEWSEGAVATLLDAYESKWLLRNRAKLKGNDWEDVARQVSTRAEGAKSAKTQTQCKNKIESMKKRYRSESTSANANNSSWPLYARMDSLLRCRPPMASPIPIQTQTPTPTPTPIPLTICAPTQDLPLQEPGPVLPPQPPPLLGNGQHRVAEEEAEEEAEQAREEEVGCGGGGGGGGFGEGSNQEDGSNTLPNRKESAALDTDTSTPRSKIANAADDHVAKEIGANCNFSCKRRKTSPPGSGGGGELAESIRSFADTIVKLEHAKMRMYKDSERLRAETEVRRGELELKRTEMIAKTQLQIARLLSGKNGKRKLADRNSTLALPEAAAQPPSHPLLHD